MNNFEFEIQVLDCSNLDQNLADISISDFQVGWVLALLSSVIQLYIAGVLLNPDPGNQMTEAKSQINILHSPYHNTRIYEPVFVYFLKVFPWLEASQCV